MIYILTAQMASRAVETTSLTGRRVICRIKAGFTPLKIPSRDYKPKSLTGFTFIELLLVVILLGVITTISVPNFRNTYYNFLLSDTAHNLTYLMRYAQARAIAERSNYRINFNSERSKFWLTNESDSEENKFLRLEGKFGKVFNIDDNMKLESEAEIINFYSNGRIDRVNIYLSNNKEKFYTISTEAQSGYVQEFDYKR